MGDDSADRSVEQRLADLAATVRRQQETIDRLRERLDGAGGDEPDRGTDADGTAGRRSAMAAAGTAGLLGLGAGSASAGPQGQIGTSATPLRRLYLQKLDGGVVGGNTVTSLLGNGLQYGSTNDDLQVDAAALAGSGLSTSADGSQLVASAGSYTGALAYLSTTQSWAVGERKAVAFDATAFDEGGNFDTTKDAFIAPADGFYAVSTKVEFLAQYDLFLVVDDGNAATDVARSSYGVDYLGNALATTLSLSAGEEVRVEVERTDSFEGDSSSPETGRDATYLSVDRLG